MEKKFEEILISKTIDGNQVLRFLEVVVNEIKFINCYELYQSWVGGYLKELKKNLECYEGDFDFKTIKQVISKIQ